MSEKTTDFAEREKALRAEHEQEARKLKQKISALEAELVLHRETKNQLARDLDSARTDLADQRQTFKSGLAAVSEKNTDLEARLLTAMQRIRELEAGIHTSVSPTPPTQRRAVTEPQESTQATPETPHPDSSQQQQQQQENMLTSTGLNDKSEEMAPEGSSESKPSLEPSSHASSLSIDVEAIHAEYQEKIAALQASTQAANKELHQELEQTKSQLESARSEKEIVETKLRRVETELDGQLKDVETLREQIRQMNKTCEQLRTMCKALQGEADRMRRERDEQDEKLRDARKELETLKAEHSEVLLKKEWAENKFGSQEEKIQSLTTELAGAKKKLTELREEGEHIRQTYKAAVESMQETREKSGAAVDAALQTQQGLQRQLDAEKKAHADTKAEANAIQSRNAEQGARIAQLEHDLQESQDNGERLKSLVAKLQLEIKELAALKDENDSLKKARSALEQENSMILSASERCSKTLEKTQAQVRELQAQVESLREGMGRLEVEKTGVHTQAAEATRELEEVKLRRDELEEELQRTRRHLDEAIQERSSSVGEITYLTSQINSLEEEKQSLTVKYEEALEEVKTLKRKHANALKDMSRQLQQAQRKVDSLQQSSTNGSSGSNNGSGVGGGAVHSSNAASGEMVSVRSSAASESPTGSPPSTPDLRRMRASSIDKGMSSILLGSPEPRAPSLHSAASFSTAPGTPQGSTAHLVPHATVAELRLDHGSGHRRTMSSSSHSSAGGGLRLEEENQHLLDKVCKLQRELEKREEKVAFYATHVEDLTEELKKKSHIIQDYLVRERRGTVAPQVPVPQVQSMPSKKASAAMSLFGGSKPTAPNGMTMEQLLEVNRTLQEVLEDTLLKNIELKGNLDVMSKQLSSTS